METKVYLAGGIRSGWQNNMPKINGVEYFDPSKKESDKSLTLSEFGTWDLHFIKESNIVFAYMEKTNPSGIGMAVEIGYAKALGKTVILCIEPNNDTIKQHRLDFMKKVSDVVYETFDEAVNYLRLFENTNRL